jgi:toxin ParE1/3/4
MSGPSKHQLKITAPALSDVEAIAAYTYERWGELQTKAYMTQIESTIQTIGSDPALGRERYGVPRAIKGRKSGSHIVFYRVQDRTIFIMRILHESMDHGRHIVVHGSSE